MPRTCAPRSAAARMAPARPRRPQPLHRRPGRADAGDDQHPRALGDLRLGRDLDADAEPLERRSQAAQVAGAVVDHRDRGHRLPFVEGIAPARRGSLGHGGPQRARQRLEGRLEHVVVVGARAARRGCRGGRSARACRRSAARGCRGARRSGRSRTAARSRRRRGRRGRPSRAPAPRRAARGRRRSGRCRPGRRGRRRAPGRARSRRPRPCGARRPTGRPCRSARGRSGSGSTSAVSMWSSMPIPVATAARPEPSSATRQRMSVSARAALGGADPRPGRRVGGARRAAPSAASRTSSSAGVAGLIRMWRREQRVGERAHDEALLEEPFRDRRPPARRGRRAGSSRTSPAPRARPRGAPPPCGRARRRSRRPGRASRRPRGARSRRAATENDEIEAGGRIASSRRAISGGARM